MKKYDVIAVGTGSAMNVVDTLIKMEPHVKVAVIDKDEPGGICLTRACIPTKLLVYPADVLRMVEEAERFGIEAEIRKIDFSFVMNRMRSIVDEDSRRIGNALRRIENVDYYRAQAEFTAPYRMKVAGETITAGMIFLCIGSRPEVPSIKGLEEAGYYTSDTIIRIEERPERLAIVGGGYVAAEFGHFFSAMGSRVTVIGRNRRLLPREEPEISSLALETMSGHMDILTDQQLLEVRAKTSGEKELVTRSRATGEEKTVTADEILVAAGRVSNADLLHPERTGVETDGKGWLVVNDYLETTQKNIWALGDATGRYLYKHVANYESKVVFYNALMGEKVKADYHAVPHAVFSYPEVAGVGLREEEAIGKYGEEGVLIGFQRYEDTARGQAMDVSDFFVKVIVKEESNEIVGAHIIGPQASILIQEVVNLMYTQGRTYTPIVEGMHIHPALGEVVERAFGSLMTPHEYHHLLEDYGFSPVSDV